MLPDQDGRRDTGVRAVMFTDMVGSTEMTSRYGDDAAMAMLRVHDRIVREALKRQWRTRSQAYRRRHHGRIPFGGRAVRGRLPDAGGRCSEHNGGQPEFPVVVRVGISAGEPIEQSSDLFGSTVQLAARLCAQADPGQILVSSVVADLCIGKSLKFSDTREMPAQGLRPSRSKPGSSN